MKTRRLVIRVAAVLVLIIIGIIMSIIGRGHTIYLDNKTLEYNGQTYKAPYKVTIYVGDEQLTKLYDKERCMVTNIGDSLELTVEVMQQKGGSETTETYKLTLPHSIDSVIINLPAYMAGLPEEAYLEEFIPAPSADLDDEEVPNTEDDMGLGDI